MAFHQQVKTLTFIFFWKYGIHIRTEILYPLREATSWFHGRIGGFDSLVADFYCDDDSSSFCQQGDRGALHAGETRQE